MPPRRSHKKSKAGCQRCKSRKIKVGGPSFGQPALYLTCQQCDEIHPVCSNCAKHGVSCDFQDAGASTLTPKGQLPASPRPLDRSPRDSLPPMPEDAITANLDPAASRSLELRLMHNYTALTASTFSDKPDQTHAWQLSVPALAHEADYLLDAILAISALHLRALHPADQTLVRASHGYMASALAQYSTLLRNGVCEDNAEALFSTATLIAFQSSASRLFDDSDDGYVLPLAWFHSYQGIKTVVIASWQWLRNSTRIQPIISGQPSLSLDLHPDKKTFFSHLLDGVDEQIASEPEETSAETRQGYQHAIAFLNWAHQKPERERITAFAATVSRRFVTLIGERDPRALVIIACFFAMMRVVDDVWWLRGIAKKEVTGIHGLLPAEWLAKMEWPVKVANHEGPMDDDTWGVSNWSNREPDAKEEVTGSVRAHIDLLTELMSEAAKMPPD